MTERVPLVTRVAGSPHGGRFASLEGYRAIAAVIVVLYHTMDTVRTVRPDDPATPVSNMGNYGVAMFFVLSGFLLYLPTSRALFRGVRPPAAGRFLLRRFARIFPAYWLAIVGWAAVVDTASRQRANPLKMFFLLDGSLAGLGVSWTLTIELTFYVLVAMLSVALPFVCRRWSGRAAVLKVQLSVVLIMALVGHVYRVINSGRGARLLHENSILAFLDWFAYGMAMALAVAWTGEGGSLPSAVKGLAARAGTCVYLGLFCYLAVMIVDRYRPSLAVAEASSAYLFRGAVQPLAAAIVLLPAMLGRADHPTQVFLRRPFIAALGTVSYGIYLWHVVVLHVVADQKILFGSFWGVGVNFTIVLAITVVIATISYRLVERPILNLVPSARPSESPPPRLRPEMAST